MGKCMKCGNYMPWDTGLCTACKEAEAKANARRYEQDEKRREDQRRRQEEWEAQHGVKGGWADKDGNVYTEYRDGRIEKTSARRVTFEFWRMIIILALIIAGAFTGIRYYSYNKNEKNLQATFEIRQTESGDGSNVISTALSGGNTYAVYRLSVSPEPKSFASSIFDFSDSFALVDNFTANGKTAYRFHFSGYDYSTGLEGEYYLAEIDGGRAIIDSDRGKVYMEGSEFFGKHIEKLEAFNPTEVLKSLTEKVSGGEYGINSEYYVLKKDGVLLSCSGDGNRVNALDESGEERLSYKVQYYESSMGKLPNYSEYEIVD